MRLIAIILISSLFGSVARASECPNAIDLAVGDKITDCDRVGLSREYAKTVKTELIEADFNKKIVSEQKRLIEIKDLALTASMEQADLWKAQEAKTRATLEDERSRAGRPFWLGMLAGVGLVLASAWAVGQVK